MVIRTTGMGITQPISHIPDRIPAYDKKKREHLWTVLTMYRIVDPLAAMSGATQLLDTENLLTTTPIGCFYCEQGWTKTLHYRSCSGEPSPEA